MNEILNKNLNQVAATVTLAVMLTTNGNPDDELLTAINGVVLSSVARQFKEKQNIDFVMEKHEIPTEYCAEALQRVMFIARMAAMATGMGK